MELLDYLVVFRRYWRSLLAITILGALLGAAAGLATSPRYQASATMMVNVRTTPSTPTEAYDASLLSALLAKSYANLVGDRSVAQEVQKRVAPNTSLSELQSRIKARAVTDTNLVVVSVSDSKAARAQFLANTVAGIFAQHIASVQTLGTGSKAPADVVLAVPAGLPTSPSNPGPMRLALYGGAIGLVIGFGIALLRQRASTRANAASVARQSASFRGDPREDGEGTERLADPINNHQSEAVQDAAVSARTNRA